MGKPESVGRIGYMTRNDDNNVRIGDTYELFYWDMDWVSLGKQIADDFSLTFHHIPQNALLLLRDLTRGRMNEFSCIKMLSRYGIDSSAKCHP